MFHKSLVLVRKAFLTFSPKNFVLSTVLLLRDFVGFGTTATVVTDFLFCHPIYSLAWVEKGATDRLRMTEAGVSTAKARAPHQGFATLGMDIFIFHVFSLPTCRTCADGHVGNAGLVVFPSSGQKKLKMLPKTHDISVFSSL